MKQLLFLLLFPCLALAQYQGNANQKITLGEQTTADGLVWRGVANLDTVTATSKITRANKQDTSAYLLLDTVTNLLWHYKTASNGWIQAGGSTLDTATMLLPYWRSGRFSGVLPLENGGTGSITQNFVDLTTTQSIGGVKTFTSAVTATRFNPTATTVTGNGMYLPATNTIGFSTNGTNRMTLDASGNVGIGTTSPTKNLDVFGSDGTLGITRTGQTGNNDRGFMYLSGSSSDGTTIKDLVQFGSSYISSTVNAEVGQFKVNVINNGTIATSLFVVNGDGNAGVGTGSPSAKLNVMGTVRINSASAPDANYYLQLENSSSQKAKANAWETYSDKRIKTNIQPILNAIDKVNLLNPVYYEKHDSYVNNDFLNIDFDSSVKSLGFIAQEVYNIIPEAVNTGTTNELWAMDYTKIIPILTKAIQEQQALIKALEQRILNLENK